MADLTRVVAALPDPVVHLLSRAKAKVLHRRSRAFYEPIIDEIMPAAAGVELLVANDDAAVFRVTTNASDPLIVKLASSEVADSLLVAESHALDELHALTELGTWREMIATVQERGSHTHGTWFSQTNLPGVPASRAAAEASAIVDAAVAALETAHNATAESATATDEVLDRLVAEPVALIARWRPEHTDALAGIEHDLRRQLAGRELSLSRMHGDFAPTNVLWDHDRVTGIVDWKFTPDRWPPEIDYVHFPLSLVMAKLRTEYGTTVTRMLDGSMTANDTELIERAIQAGPNTFSNRTAVTLAWLQHIAFGLHKAPDLRVNPIWLHNNIDAVIGWLAAN